jgi:serine/threonine protein kinase
MVPSDVTEQLAKEICVKHEFKFVRSCDAGAFKRTYLVRQGENTFALKLVVGNIDNARVSREIDALSRCNHPNLCKLHQVGTITHSGREIVYLVEEFLPGGTLAALVNKTGLLDLPATKAVAIHLLEGMLHLLNQNIIHRDIKPENIMFREDRTTVLVDLGLARHLDASSLTASWAMQGPGTPGYAPPEQLLNEKHLIDWRADQFALGITLSVTGLGMHPYTGSETFDGAVDAIAARKGPTRSFKQRATGAGMTTLIRMVEPWPIKRFRDPNELQLAWTS